MINFITPNKLLRAMALSVKALGLELDLPAFCADVETTLNSAGNMRAAEKLVGEYIPDDLAVCVSSCRASNDICRKYGIPVSEVATAAAIALDLDSRYKAVLILSAEYMHDINVIKHELVHWNQVKSGDLVHSDSYITWARPGEFFQVSVSEDIVNKRRFGDDIDSYLYYELSKPWEAEAYALTTPKRALAELSPRNMSLITAYLDKAH